MTSLGCNDDLQSRCCRCALHALAGALGFVQVDAVVHPNGKRAHLHAATQVGTIENEYRVFQMEVLAGPPCLDTEVSQHGARFRLNFGEVRGRQVPRQLRHAEQFCRALWPWTS